MSNELNGARAEAGMSLDAMGAALNDGLGTLDAAITGGWAGGQQFVDNARLASTANIDLATGGLLVIDGVQTVADDRVMVKDQTDTTENGIYDVVDGTWTRSADAPDAASMHGVVVYIEEGTANGGKLLVLTAAGDSVTAGDTFVSGELVLKPISVNDYTVTTEDLGFWLLVRGADPTSSDPVTVTFPDMAEEFWGRNNEIMVQQIGLGQLTIVKGSGVNIAAPHGLVFPSRYATMRLKVREHNTWLVDTPFSSGAAAPFDRGTITTGTETPVLAEGEMHVAVNGGAHTWAAPPTTGCFTVTYTNGAAAGAITASGFDVVTDPDGALSHTVENSIIRGVVYNDGVAKELIVALIVDATP